MGTNPTDTAATVSTALLARAVRLTAGGHDALPVDVTHLSPRASTAALTTLDVLTRISLGGVLHTRHHGDKPKEAVCTAHEPEEVAVHLSFDAQKAIAQNAAVALSVERHVVTRSSRRAGRKEEEDTE